MVSHPLLGGPVGKYQTRVTPAIHVLRDCCIQVRRVPPATENSASLLGISKSRPALEGGARMEALADADASCTGPGHRPGTRHRRI